MNLQNKSGITTYHVIEEPKDQRSDIKIHAYLELANNGIYLHHFGIYCGM
jgi:hypothetical protein